MFYLLSIIQNLIATFSAQTQTKQNWEAVDALSLEWAFEQSALVDCILTHGRGVGTRWSLKCLPTPTIPQSCEIWHKKSLTLNIWNSRGMPLWKSIWKGKTSRCNSASRYLLHCNTMLLFFLKESLYLPKIYMFAFKQKRKISRKVPAWKLY